MPRRSGARKGIGTSDTRSEYCSDNPRVNRHALALLRGARDRRPRAISQTDALEWSAVLRSTSSWDAYKARHGAEVEPTRVAALLLLFEEFPRSVAFCMTQLNTALRRISGTPEGRFSNEAEKLSGRLLAELHFSTIDEIFEHGLHDYLDLAQQKFNAIGQALLNAYIFQPFSSMADEMLQQQQQQQ